MDIAMFSEEGALETVQSGVIDEDLNDFRKRGIRFVVLTPTEDDWLPPGETWFVRRPQLAPLVSKIELLADGKDTITIEGLPTPCTILIDTAQVEVTDGKLEFTADVVGQYKLVLNHWPYLEWTLTLEATRAV